MRVEARGQQRVYSLAGDKLAEVDAWIAPYRQFWAGRLDALDQHLEAEQ